jgi:hypothetical protein
METAPARRLFLWGPIVSIQRGFSLAPEQNVPYLFFVRAMFRHVPSWLVEPSGA